MIKNNNMKNNLKTIENNLDKKYNELLKSLLDSKMYNDAKELIDLYFETKTNSYKRGSNMAEQIFNK